MERKHGRIGQMESISCKEVIGTVQTMEKSDMLLRLHNSQHLPIYGNQDHHGYHTGIACKSEGAHAASTNSHRVFMLSGTRALISKRLDSLIGSFLIRYYHES